MITIVVCFALCAKQVFHAMHSVLLHRLGIYIVVFSIPRLLNPDTRQQVGSMDARAFI